MVALRDVENPLLGERGAARVFGPQKGATPPVVERLERGLERLAAAIEHNLGLDLRGLVGGGSAGGAGAGAVAFLDARLTPGARLVLRLSRFDARLRRADVVITGEGRLDAQSLDGKVVSAVATAAARRGVPVAASPDAWRSTKPWPPPTGYARWKRRRLPTFPTPKRWREPSRCWRPRRRD